MNLAANNLASQKQRDSPITHAMPETIPMWIATTGSLDGRVRVAAYAHRTNVAGPQFHGDVEVKLPLASETLT